MRNVLSCLLLFSLMSFSSLSQSLSPERIKKIKSSTVQVLVPDVSSSGTGFFIDDRGTIVTSWHVIAPAISNLPSVKKIMIMFNDGVTQEMEIIREQLTDITQAKNAVAYDYCLLKPASKISHDFSYLKLGSFTDLREGQEVYTCGYPLGYPQQFVSKGFVSTKYVLDSNAVFNQQNKSEKTILPRDQALIDITLNRGNSGGAVIALGTNIDEDVVVGVAGFGVSPIGANADRIVESSKQMIGTMSYQEMDSTGKVISSVDPNLNFTIIAQAVGNMSIGVSGCISIDHLKPAVKALVED